MSFVSWLSKISFFQTYTSANFKFSVPYKINLLGFTKSPNNDLLIYFNIKYKWFVEMKYIVFNFHTKNCNTIILSICKRNS